MDIGSSNIGIEVRIRCESAFSVTKSHSDSRTVFSDLLRVSASCLTLHS